MLQEALRLHTPVPMIQRVLTEDVIIDGRLVPRHTPVDVILYNAHHNAEVWPKAVSE